MISIEKAFKFPFAQENWQKTVGVYFLVTLGIALVSFLLQLVFQVPADVLRAIAQESGDSSIALLSSSAGAAYTIFSSLLSLVIFPVTLYLSGYVFDVVRHMVYGIEPAITLHGNYVFRIKLGVVRMAISLILGLSSLILLLIPALTGFAGGLSMDSYPVLGVTLLVITGIFSIVWILLVLLGIRLLQYGMEYLYLTKGFKYIFNMPEVLTIVSKNIKHFLLLYGVEVVSTFAMGAIFVICCVIPFIYPAVTTVMVFVLAYLYGMTFRNIKE